MLKICIGISVGTKHFVSYDWVSIFQWACSKASFRGEIILEVADTLQRHTHAICTPGLIKLEATILMKTEKGCSNTEINKLKIELQRLKNKLFYEALDKGAMWIKYNVQDKTDKLRYIAKSFGVTFHEKPIRWEYWRKHTQFRNFRKKIDEFYKTNQTFRQAMHISIEEAKARFQLNRDYYPTIENTGIPENILNQIITRYCYSYLAEEAAIVMGLWQENLYNLIVYPRKIIDILAEAKKLFIGDPLKFKSLLNWNTVGRKVPKLPAEQFVHQFNELSRMHRERVLAKYNSNEYDSSLFKGILSNINETYSTSSFYNQDEYVALLLMEISKHILELHKVNEE